MVEDEAAKAHKFVRGLRLDLQGFIRAFRPTTNIDALCLAVNMSLHERVDPSKAAGKGSTSGQKRMVEQQPANITLRDLSSGGTFRHHQLR
ncbi:gag-protease polyprotein [Cucumis melo var. makuwa]|uniref:Gag-protease polyprotein n=1 Tax=Cucumis melo var. makuwa TaxID=1194695 RepID=A0A5A7TYG5_CUCMM|nr:gag-protease polyprotein [Cucumis melo var. makuwa]